MEFLFGLFTFWFVVASALFIRDAKKGDLARPVAYLIWPEVLWRLWYPAEC